MELLWLFLGCAGLVGVLYVVSALYRAYRLRQEQYEIAKSDAWERHMQQRENHYDNGC